MVLLPNSVAARSLAVIVGSNPADGMAGWLSVVSGVDHCLFKRSARKNRPVTRDNKIIINKKTNNTFLIDIAVPNTHNLSKTITDKQNKYQELANEIYAVWKQNTTQVIPLVISSTGVIPKSKKT